MVNFEAILFDFDGTLVDTQYLYNKAVFEIISKESPKYTFDYCQQIFDGKCWQEVFAEMQKYETFDTKKVMDESIAYAHELIDKHASSTNGTEEALETLAQNNIPIAICSNSYVYEIQKVLKQINLKKYFKDENIFGRDCVQNGKPNSDIYLFACKKLNVLTQNVIAIEDTMSGAKASIGANISTVIFTGSKSFHNIEKFHKAFGDIKTFDNMKNFATFVISNANGQYKK